MRGARSRSSGPEEDVWGRSGDIWRRERSRSLEVELLAEVVVDEDD